MLKISTSNHGPLQLTPELTQPAVYLDYCVIGDLACDFVLGQEFRDYLLAKNGTLYLSWAHLIELFGLGKGRTYDSIRFYLASFNRNFVLIDSDALAVIRREAEWSYGKQNPVLDEQFLVCLIANWNGLTEINMDLLLGTVASDPAFFTKLQARHLQHKLSLKKTFDDSRDRYRTDQEWKDQVDNARYNHVPGTPSTHYIYRQILRECITTHEQFNPSDSLDFEHCVVSLAYCDYVVLDKKWARRCGKIDRPQGTAAVFSGVEIDRLVQEIKSWPKVAAPSSAVR